MDITLLHPKIVHLPIALAVLMPLISGGLLIAWWREWFPKRVWFLAVLFQAVLLASGFAALQTGEADEEPVENVVAEQYIEAHEEAAEVFVWTSAIVLFLLLGAGLLPNERKGQGLATVATLGTLVVLGLGFRVGEAGGALVYEHGAANAFVNAAQLSGNSEVKSGKVTHGRDADDDDDD